MIESLLTNPISRSNLTEDWANLPLVFQHNPIATIVFGVDNWLISAVNPAACRLYGYSSSEMLGMSLLELIRTPPFASFGPTEFELKSMFLSRSEPWAHKSKEGKEILVQTVVRGLTWKTRSAHILFVNDKTESMLAQQQLLDALNKMEAALRAKTQFLSTMSHEIRTPLHGVIGMTAKLEESELDEVQRDCVKTIKASGELLLSIVNDILDFTKAEQNKLTLEMREFDLQEFVDEVVEVIEVPAGEKGLSVGTSMASDLPLNLLGDSGRLRQILMNLLTNAVKFTDTGSIDISIRLAEGGARPKLRFEVRDTGIGISAESKAQIFQGLGQADSSATRRFGGTGLGLAISKRLVQMMDGEIGVSSEPAQGSTFWFTAQFLTGPQPAHAQNATGHLAGAEVLVLQNNPKERAATRRLLEGLGMLVTEAANAAEALARFAQFGEERGPGAAEFAFCLADASLPVIDGMEFARILRRQAFGRKTGIVLAVSHHSPEQSAEGREIGISSFEIKPLRKKQLAFAFGRAAADLASQTAATAPSARPAPVTENGTPPAILLVEDNVVNQKVATHSLLKLGYAVEVAANGLQALDAFERRPFDLILMDCHMPVMDGYTATQKIRACGVSGRQVPIIAMTADVVDTQRERCIAAGMNDFLSKPVKREVLSDMLTHWLART